MLVAVQFTLDMRQRDREIEKEDNYIYGVIQEINFKNLTTAGVEMKVD